VNQVKKIIFLLLLVLASTAVPASFVSADYASELNGIRNAIDAQTRAYTAAERKAAFDALDQTCVAAMRNQILEKDTYLKDVDKSIDEYTAKMQKMDMSNPATSQEASSYLDYLWRLRKRQSDIYDGYIIDGCSNYKPVQQCQSGYVNIQGSECITLDAACVALRGPNTVMESYDPTTRNYRCKCAPGYVLNGSSQCIAQEVQPTPVAVAAPTPKTAPSDLDKAVMEKVQQKHAQLCQYSLGEHSIPVGDSIACACASGYKVADDSKHCVAEAVVTATASQPTPDTSVATPAPRNGFIAWILSFFGF